MIKLERLESVMGRTALSRSKVYSLMEQGLFPKPAKIGGTRINAWPSHEIDKWIESRLEEREAA